MDASSGPDIGTGETLPYHYVPGRPISSPHPVRCESLFSSWKRVQGLIWVQGRPYTTISLQTWSPHFQSTRVPIFIMDASLGPIWVQGKCYHIITYLVSPFPVHTPYDSCPYFHHGRQFRSNIGTEDPLQYHITTYLVSPFPVQTPYDVSPYFHNRHQLRAQYRYTGHLMLPYHYIPGRPISSQHPVQLESLFSSWTPVQGPIWVPGRPASCVFALLVRHTGSSSCPVICGLDLVLMGK